MTANINEDSSSHKCQLSSMTQRSSRRIEKRGSKTSRSRRSQRVGGGKNIKSKKSEESHEVFDIVKELMIEHDSWKKEKDLENTKELVEEFEERMNTEVRRQEKLEAMEESDFRRGELPEKYMTKMLYR